MHITAKYFDNVYDLEVERLAPFAQEEDLRREERADVTNRL